MNIIQAVVLGLVEGITEYLPVSSTGHLIIAADLLGLGETPSQQEAVDTFNIVVQGGAILAVLGLYFPRIVQMCKGLLGKDKAGLKLAINIIIAFMPAAVLGVLLNDLIEEKLFNTPSVITALALGGVFMIALDRMKFRKVDTDGDPENDLIELSPGKALFIGFMQCIAMWPGTSRSMMTIVAGVMSGLKPKQAAEFSFLLGLPTLGGACVYSLAKNLKASSENGTPNMFELLGWTPIAVGLIVATISAAFAVKWLVAFLNKHGLAPFGYYRLVLAAVLATLIGMGVVQIGGETETTPTPAVNIDE
ncbi:MAG: UDP-diphosphatase [Phycisphaerae bacterium]|nr:UDP-diphosphatase [Phycisphaerae bacterium]MBM92175.1 UDP-diphosphatase [Phycisphaerae bacterium]